MKTTKEVIDYLVKKGYKRHHAAGIVANLYHESGFDPGILGDGGKAYGIAQWHADRQKLFKKKYGKSIKGSTIQEQLDFLDYELKTTEKSAYNKLLKSKDAQSAALAFGAFERFKGYEDPNHRENKERMKMASSLNNEKYNQSFTEPTSETMATNSTFTYTEEDIKNDPQYEEFKAYAKKTGKELTTKTYESIKDDFYKDLENRERSEQDEVLNNIFNYEVPENFNKGYNPETQKVGDLPISEIASSLFGIVNGNQMANTDLPERDEEVSGLFKNYTAEIRRLSEIGLKPEEEAYAKNMLADSYQASLDMIQRASNGNRNVVLGNLGRLDYQNQKGLMDLMIADSRAKTEALFKYGEAVKYISEKDSARDIANNEREYQNAMLTKRAGAELSSQAWGNLMDNIQYYKENKPGSANHMLKTHLIRNSFGVDYNETDPTNYYHPDNFRKKQQALEEYGKKVTTTRDMLRGLDKEDQYYFADYIKKSGYDYNNPNTIGFLGYLDQNRGQRGAMDLTKMDQAITNNDFGLLFEHSTPYNAFSAREAPGIQEPEFDKPTLPSFANVNKFPSLENKELYANLFNTEK